MRRMAWHLGCVLIIAGCGTPGMIEVDDARMLAAPADGAWTVDVDARGTTLPGAIRFRIDLSRRESPTIIRRYEVEFVDAAGNALEALRIGLADLPQPVAIVPDPGKPYTPGVVDVPVVTEAVRSYLAEHAPGTKIEAKVTIETACESCTSRRITVPIGLVGTTPPH